MAMPYNPEQHGDYDEWREMRMSEARRRQDLFESARGPVKTTWGETLVENAGVLVFIAVAVSASVLIWQEATKPSSPREPWRPCAERVEARFVERCERDEYYSSLADSEPEPVYRGRP